MKPLAALSLLLLVGCASHRQLRCRFVAVNGRGEIMPAATTKMHSHWHGGFAACAAMIEGLANGTIEETITGDEAGVEVKGPKAQRLRLKRFFDAEPTDMKGVAMVRKPSFEKLMEVAE